MEKYSIALDSNRTACYYHGINRTKFDFNCVSDVLVVGVEELLCCFEEKK